MCICINCRHINKCQVYKFIEEQHKGTKIGIYNSTFFPSDTIISVNMNKDNSDIILDWDLKECSSFVEKPNNWCIFN